MLVAFLFALAATNGFASLIAHEPYNYPLGTAPTYAFGTPTQTTGGGFGGGYNGGGLTTVAGLSYSGLGSTYNALKQTAAYSGENLATPVASGTVYISYLFNVGSNPGGNLVGLEMNTSGNGMFVGITAPYSGTQGFYGVNQQTGYNDSSSNKWQSASANATYGITYFVVVKLTGTGAGWTGSIWINPTANTSTEPAATGTFTMPQFTLTACSIVNPSGAGGNFLFDELRIGTTWADAVDYTVPAPSAPINLSATPGGNSVSLTWYAAAGSPTSYNVKRSTTSGSGYVTVSGAGTVTGTNFTDAVAGGTTYYYVVTAVNSGGESAYSSEVSAAPTLAAPPAPAGLVANASDSQVALSWAASLAASGYQVKRSTTSGGEVTIASFATTNYTDASVANGTTYYYEISATNAAGEGANSSEVSATPNVYTSVYDSFNYVPGSFATGTASTGAGLSGNWTVGNGAMVGGLSYPGLPAGHNALSTTGSRDQVSLTSPISSGTKYFSFLFNQLGNNGGNLNGLVLYGSGATSLILGLTAPYSGTAGSFGLGSIATAGAGATGITTFSGLQITGGFNYNQTHLVVVRIDFNTFEANDTVSVWLDPAAGTNSPAGRANMVWSNYDVGTITGIGSNIQGGGFADEFDEFRTGNSYGSVVGAPAGTLPTTLGLAVGAGKEISWTAASTNYYQVQSSTDGVNWNNLGTQFTGSTVTSLFDPAPAAYYQVLQDTPVVTETVANGGFETSDGNGGASNWLGIGSELPVQIITDDHAGNACMSLAVTNLASEANTSQIQQNVANQGTPILGGNTYNFSFWAKQNGAGPSYVQSYKIGWLDAGSMEVGTVGFNAITTSGTNWTLISPGTVVAPATTTTALIQFVVATGSVVGGYGGLLVDDVSLNTVGPSGSPTVIPATVQAGAFFTANVETNQLLAAEASGTVAFKLNGVPLGLGTVTGGTASSTPGAVPNSYTLTAIYSGDSVFAASTNTLVVSEVNRTPTNLVVSVSGNQLTIAWPADHTGWILQSQTNTLSQGLGTNWVDVIGSTATNQVTLTVDLTAPAVFYRMKY